MKTTDQHPTFRADIDPKSGQACVISTSVLGESIRCFFGGAADVAWTLAQGEAQSLNRQMAVDARWTTR